MSTVLSTTELRTLTKDDLLRARRDQRLLVAKLRLGVELQKEKDTAKLRRARRMLARMETVLTEKNSTKSKSTKSSKSERSSISSISSTSSHSSSKPLSKPKKTSTLSVS